MNETKEAARTNYLLVKLLYRKYIKAVPTTSLPLSEKEYYQKLNGEFETIWNQKEKLVTASNSSIAKKKKKEK